MSTPNLKIDLDVAIAWAEKSGPLFVDDLKSLATPPSPAPEGWVTVPREPTPEMLRAGFLADDGSDEGIQMHGQVYRAMISAAPAAPTEVSDE